MRGTNKPIYGLCKNKKSCLPLMGAVLKSEIQGSDARWTYCFTFRYVLLKNYKKQFLHRVLDKHCASANGGALSCQTSWALKGALKKKKNCQSPFSLKNCTTINNIYCTGICQSTKKSSLLFMNFFALMKMKSHLLSKVGCWCAACPKVSEVGLISDLLNCVIL